MVGDGSERYVIALLMKVKYRAGNLAFSALHGEAAGDLCKYCSSE